MAHNTTDVGFIVIEKKMIVMRLALVRTNSVSRRAWASISEWMTPTASAKPTK